MMQNNRASSRLCRHDEAGLFYIIIGLTLHQQKYLYQEHHNGIPCLWDVSIASRAVFINHLKMQCIGPLSSEKPINIHKDKSIVMTR